MATVSPQPSASSRKVLQLILQRIADLKYQTVADAIGRDESTVSRIVSGDSGVKLQELVPFLDITGFKLVPKDHYCVQLDRWNALVVYAKIGMEHERKVEGPQLEWGEK